MKSFSIFCWKDHRVFDEKLSKPGGDDFPATDEAYQLFIKKNNPCCWWEGSNASDENLIKLMMVNFLNFLLEASRATDEKLSVHLIRIFFLAFDGTLLKRLMKSFLCCWRWIFELHNLGRNSTETLSELHEFLMRCFPSIWSETHRAG